MCEIGELVATWIIEGRQYQLLAGAAAALPFLPSCNGRERMGRGERMGRKLGDERMGRETGERETGERETGERESFSVVIKECSVIDPLGFRRRRERRRSYYTKVHQNKMNAATFLVLIYILF